MTDSSTFQLKFRPPGSPPGGAIRYGLGRCGLGLFLAARSGDGVCAIFLGDDEAALLAELRAAIPDAAPAEASAAMQADMDRIVSMLDGRGAIAADAAHGASSEDRRPPLTGGGHGAPGGRPPLVLDVGGTAFQQRVWRALCTIPAGQTRSYRELADALGMPRASRAVGGACAANLLAVAIPCHRALRADGGLSGYRWGLARKQALLDRERQTS